ncbi:hypothetical protein [Bradyrhizobium sp. F1.13.3]|uniref:hypothetical protein n=1 Tax=Bradyrhizobium sp. F1.13.3 TaxID=3156351 RepID=UPI00339AB632
MILDSEWFNAHPHRRHRVRSISFVEAMSGIPSKKLAIVRRVRPFELMTLYADGNGAELGVLGEDEARALFEFTLSKMPTRMRTQLQAQAEPRPMKRRKR